MILPILSYIVGNSPRRAMISALIFLTISIVIGTLEWGRKPFSTDQLPAYPDKDERGYFKLVPMGVEELTEARDGKNRSFLIKDSNRINFIIQAWDEDGDKILKNLPLHQSAAFNERPWSGTALRDIQDKRMDLREAKNLILLNFIEHPTAGNNLPPRGIATGFFGFISLAFFIRAYRSHHRQTKISLLQV